MPVQQASEAMQDRYTMVNFYLIMVGVVASGIIAIFGKESSLPKSTGGLLLWLLCGIGWIYFLKIIRLRQAWHDSARTMGHIKEFYIQYAKDIQQYDLRSAFRWQLHTLPAVGKPWTVFFYSIMLIAFLNSIAYVVGGVLLKLGSGTGPLPALDTLPQGYLMWLVFFGLLLFAFHISVVPSLLS